MEEKIELIKKHLTEIGEELFKTYGADSYQLRCMIYDVKDSVSKLHQPTVSGSAIQVIKWMADCPYTIDQATIPKNGIDAAPMQVVGNMSLSYLKYKQLRDVAEHYR